MPFLEIMYADDDRDDRDIFAGIVHKINQENTSRMHLTTFDSGAEIIKALKKNPAKKRVVFLDINLPVRNGFEVLSEIRSDADLGETPVVIYATSSDQKVINISFDLGANLYIIKSGSVTESKELIQKVTTIDWKNFKADHSNFVLNPRKENK